MTKLTAAFHNFANALRNQTWRITPRATQYAWI